MSAIDKDIQKYVQQRKTKLAKAVKDYAKRFREGKLAGSYIRQSHDKKIGGKSYEDFIDAEEPVLAKYEGKQPVVIDIDNNGLFEGEFFIKGTLAGMVSVPGEKFKFKRSTVPDVVVRIDYNHNVRLLDNYFVDGEIIWGWELADKLDKLAADI